MPAGRDSLSFPDRLSVLLRGIGPDWLFRPTLPAFLFALRTTAASLLALAIALWMELGEPQWAAMTVWIVAQGSRGESISKGRWRLVGTVLGASCAIVLMALFPQAPWLFLPLLALWVGACAGFATLTHNFRGYALVLAGYTCTIIALGAVSDPEHVFNIAMARGTYIFLGVLCETVLGMVFVPDVAGKARLDLQRRLQGILTQSVGALTEVLEGHPDATGALCRLMGSLPAASKQIEFARIEIQGRGHEVGNAYAVLGLLARVLSRGLGLKTRMAAVPFIPDGVLPFLGRMAEGLREISRLVIAEGASVAALVEGEILLTECRGRMGEVLPRDDDESLNEGIVLAGVEVMLLDLCDVLRSYRASVVGAPVAERYRLRSGRDWRAAARNGARVFVAMMAASLLWEVTAWPEGGTFLTFIAVVCAGFATSENTVLGSTGFFYGGIGAVLGSIVPVFLVLPLTSSYPLFCVCIGFFMVLGGLASRNPGTAMMGASYSTFFPMLLGVSNQGRMDEVSWLNTATAFLLGLGAGVLVFRIVLPFTPRKAVRVLRVQLKRSLKRLALPGADMDDRGWVNDGAQSMERAVRFTGALGEVRSGDILRGTLSVLTVGRNVLMLRRLARHGALPESAVAAVEGLLGNLLRRRLPLTHMAGVMTTTLSELYALEHETQDVSIRHDLVLAIGSLLIVESELEVSRAFLRATN